MSFRQKVIEGIRNTLEQGSEEDVLRCLDAVHGLLIEAFVAFSPAPFPSRCYASSLICIAHESRLPNSTLEEMVKRERVESRAVNSIGYDAEHELLEIEFKGGKIYQYLQVPLEEHLALMSADSIGTYVNQVIKSRYLDYQQVYD